MSLVIRHKFRQKCEIPKFCEGFSDGFFSIYNCPVTYSVVDSTNAERRSYISVTKIFRVFDIKWCKNKFIKNLWVSWNLNPPATLKLQSGLFTTTPWWLLCYINTLVSIQFITDFFVVVENPCFSSTNKRMTPLICIFSSFSLIFYSNLNFNSIVFVNFF